MYFFNEQKITGLLVDLRLNYGGINAINSSFIKMITQLSLIANF